MINKIKTCLLLMTLLLLQTPPVYAHVELSGGVLNHFRYLPCVIWWCGAGLLASAILLLCWNFALKRQVQSKTAHLEAEIEQGRANEAALRESEQKIRTMFDQAAVGVGQVCTKSGRLVHINQKFCDILGYTRDEMLQFQVQDVTHPEDLQSTTNYMQQFQSGAIREYSVEKRYRHRDGHMVWVSLNASPMWKEGDEPDFYMAVVHDITSGKQITRMLKENEARLRTLVHAIPDLVWLKDSDGTFLFCNTMFERLFGASEAEIVGKTDYDFVDRELADFFRENDRKAMAAGGACSNEEWITFADDGHRSLLDTIKTPMYDAEGHLIGVLGIGRDITGRHEAEKRQLHLERQLLHAQKLESLGVLAGGLAHDFNNLLVAMSGNLELALRKLPGESAACLNIERAMTASRHAAELTNMMLAYSGKAAFIVKEMNINDLIVDNTAMLGMAIAGNVNFNLHLDQVLPSIIADAGQLQQVIMNLIINASEACVDDNGSISISTGVREFDQITLNGSRLEEKMTAGRHVWLKVRDNGCGMDEETQNKLFDPFFTTKFTGRGLGMSAVLGIIRSHKGAFLVESSPGAGTTMLVVLPIAAGLQE